MLNPTVLSAAVKSKLISEGFIIDGNGDNSKFIDSICEAIIEHIKTFAEVNVIVTGTSPSGPVTGTGTGLPGTAIS